MLLTPVVCHTAMVSTTGAIEPSQLHLAGVELHAWISHRLQRREGILDHSDDGAVLRRDVVEIVEHLQPAGAGHVLRHDARIAGDVLADVASHQPRLDVVLAAGADPDQHVDRLAAVEVRHRIGLCRRRRNDQCQRQRAANVQS